MKNERNKKIREDTEKKPIFAGIFSALKKAGINFLWGFPFFIGIIILMGLFKAWVPNEAISHVFKGKMFIDTFIGALIGSILAGNPVNSYIIGGELLKNGVTLFAVTAFIVTWVTVGITQLPYEITTLGKKFSLTRNGLSFFLAVVVALGTVFLTRVFS